MVRSSTEQSGVVWAVLAAVLAFALLAQQAVPASPTLDTLPGQFVWLLVAVLAITWVPYLTAVGQHKLSTHKSRQLLLSRVILSASLALLFCPPSIVRSAFGAGSARTVHTVLWWAGSCCFACGIFLMVRASLSREQVRHHGNE